MTKCCVISCKNEGAHAFPKDPAIRKKWIAAIRIKKFVPTKYSRLCRDHFNENDYESICISTGLPPLHKHLKKNAVPSKFWWNQKPVKESTIARAERCARRSARRNILEQAVSSPSTSQAPHDQSQTPTSDRQGFFLTSIDQPVIEPPERDIALVPTKNIKDSENREVITESENKGMVSVSTQTSTMFSMFTTDTLLTDDQSVNFYTGLENAEKFYLVLSTLLPMAEHLKYRWSNVQNLAIEDKLLLVLIKLRRAKPDFELAKMFGVSKTQVSNIFVTWVNFMSDVWSLIDIWPSRDLVDYYMPDSFKTNKLKTRVIIDCTEIPECVTLARK